MAAKVLVAPPNPGFNAILGKKFPEFYQLRLPRLQNYNLEHLKEILPDIESFAIIGQEGDFPCFGDLNQRFESLWPGSQVLHEGLDFGPQPQSQHLIITCVDPRLNDFIGETDKMVVRLPGGRQHWDDFEAMTAAERAEILSVVGFGHNDCAAEKEWLDCLCRDCAHYLEEAKRDIWPRLFPNAAMQVSMREVEPRQNA